MKRFYDLKRYAQTGIASPGMKAFDKMFAISAFGSKFPITTLTGVDQITFDSDGKPLTAWDILANMMQDGTPTPSSIIVPQEFGDKTANLFDCERTEGITTGKYINASGAVSENPYYYISYPIYVEAGVEYTWRFDNVQAHSAPTVAFYNAGGTQIDVAAHASNITHFTFTTPSNCDFIRASVYFRNDLQKEAMLNLGSTAMDYEPFGYKIPISCAGQIYNIYLTEPLRKIGDYADTISSDGTVTRRIRKIVLTGTEDWAIDGGKNGLYSFWISSAVSPMTQYENQISSHFVLAPNYSTMYNNTGYFSVLSARIVCGYFSKSTVSSFQTWLADQYAAGTPVCIWYVLATPTTETVTAPTITPAKGANTLTIGTTLPPSEVSITGHIQAAT